MRNLKQFIWLLQNSRFSDLITYFSTWRIPTIRISNDLIVLPQGPGMENELDEKPFILVKCGFKTEKRLKMYLDKSGIENNYMGRFKGYGRAAMMLYNIDPQRSPVEDWIWLATLQQIAPGEWGEAELWTIDIPEEKLTSIKRIIRRKMGLQFYRVKHLDNKYTVTINPVHMPDKSLISREWAILSSCLYR